MNQLYQLSSEIAILEAISPRTFSCGGTGGLRQVQFGRKSLWAFAAAREHTEVSFRDTENIWEFLPAKIVFFHGNVPGQKLGLMMGMKHWFHGDFMGFQEMDTVDIYQRQEEFKRSYSMGVIVYGDYGV